MKIGLQSFSSYQVAAMRVSIAGLSLLPFLKSDNWSAVIKKIHVFFLSGLVGSAIPAFLFTAAQTRISSSLAGALNGLTPLFALAVGVLFLQVKLQRNQFFGVVVGLFGAFLLMFHRGFNGNGFHTSLVVLATLCYGINVNIIKYKLNEFKPLLVAALPLVLVGIFTGIFLLFTDLPMEFESVVFRKSLLAVLALALVGTAFSLVMFNILIQRTSAVFASSVTYLIPIVAMFWGFIDEEPITPNQIGGLLLILLAIWLIRTKRKTIT
jgi:drug/metabolite transporter (DMT)-like permease